MGSVYRRPGRSIWMMQYYRNGIRIRTSSETTSKMKAQRRCDDLETDLRRGLPITPDVGKIRFDDAAKESSVDDVGMPRCSTRRAKRADAFMPSSERTAALFHVFKKIRHAVDDTHVLAARVLHDAAGDRQRADALRVAATASEWGARFPEPPHRPTSMPDLAVMIKEILDAGEEFHALYRRAIDERERLAKELEAIRIDVNRLDLAPRRDNQGKNRRGPQP